MWSQKIKRNSQKLQFSGKGVTFVYDCLAGEGFSLLVKEHGIGQVDATYHVTTWQSWAWFVSRPCEPLTRPGVHYLRGRGRGLKM